MLLAIIALPVVVFNTPRNVAPQAGYMYAAANGFAIEIEEVSYPKSLSKNISSKERGNKPRPIADYVYPKSSERNAVVLKKGTKREGKHNIGRNYPKDIRQSLAGE
jgi:hypothetical protein